MKISLQILLTLILSFLLSMFLPFWSVAIAGFSVAIWFNHNALKSFLAGFFGVAFLWGISTWTISDANQHLLLEKVSAIFSLSNFLMLLVVSIVGGLLAGTSAATGTYLRNLVVNRT